MIRLNRPPRPSAFTVEIEQNLTVEYATTKKAVWHEAPGVVDALRAMSNQKCAYCESSIADRNTPSEIDHFADKDDYPGDVVKWTNLLPCCRGCNSRKGTHDVITKPIINPCDTEPKDHLYFSDCYFRYKTELGRETLRTLDFNIDTDLMRAIYEITLQINNFLAELADKATSSPPPVKGDVTRIRTRLVALMKNGSSKEKFSAAVSTTILKSADYALVKSFLEKNNRWDDDLSSWEAILIANALL